MSIGATDVDLNNWNIHPVYVQELEVPLECDPIYEGQKLGVIYHRIDHQVGMEHFDPFYQSLDSSTNFVCRIYFAYITLLVCESICAIIPETGWRVPINRLPCHSEW